MRNSLTFLWRSLNGTSMVGKKSFLLLLSATMFFAGVAFFALRSSTKLPSTTPTIAPPTSETPEEPRNISMGATISQILSTYSSMTYRCELSQGEWIESSYNVLGEDWIGELRCLMLNLTFSDVNGSTTIFLWFSEEGDLVQIARPGETPFPPPEDAWLYLEPAFAPFMGFGYADFFLYPEPEAGTTEYLGCEVRRAGKASLLHYKYRFTPNASNIYLENISKIDIWISPFGDSKDQFFATLYMVELKDGTWIKCEVLEITPAG
ncbi:MAG: hypothetical protein DRN90_05270 [Thermoproteota archaeon]|nr:MAG: hypothetical protein DRN90_05270 [Candidatus Korarchaeota archaeon]